MNTSDKKTLSLGPRPVKTINNQPGYAVSKPNKTHLTSVSSEDFAMDDSREYPNDNRFNRVAPQYGGRNQQQRTTYPPKKVYSKPNDGFYSKNDGFANDGLAGGSDINKVRRGPGRRLPKENRVRSMDPALMNKYGSLSPSLQEKVNATIEIYYQQQMAKAYKGQVDEEEPEEDHYAEDVVYETEITVDEE